MALLEEVFRVSGVPTHTFVEPTRYDAIKVAIRTPGRCVVLEGPSGIGKTTTVARVIQELGQGSKFLSLSARNPKDIEFITEIPTMGDIGTVIVDDFHRLPLELKQKLSDYMKILADAGNPGSKLILIGINKAGDQLVRFAHDVGMRLDIFKMEANPVEKITQLIELGEAALNVAIRDKQKIAERSQGSFHIAQVLCHNLCVDAGVTETANAVQPIDISVEVVVEHVMTDLHRVFHMPCVTFARGSKIRREGRAPYLHMLKWLSEAEDWSLDLAEAVRAHPKQKGSISQVLDKHHLETLLKDKADDLGNYFHFDPSTRVLSVEDPKIIFYLRNLIWGNFSKSVGFPARMFAGAYDYALSFAGTDRGLAQALFERLSEREISVFYDENEQHRILSKSIEDYLAPIYRSEARYVVVLMSRDYPKRIWTKFESDQFKHRFGEESVIPIRFTDVEDGFFSEAYRFGALSYDPAKDFAEQADRLVELLAKKMEEERGEAEEG
jgi:hypothetical protein